MKKKFMFLLAIILMLNFAFSNTGDIYAIESIKEQSVAILREMGAINIMEDTELEGDSIIQEPYEKLVFNESSYAFLDATGTINRINRIDEVNALYYNNVDASELSSKFDSYDAFIDYLEDMIIGDQYKLVSSNQFDDNTISLKYEKLMKNGGFDSFDSYSIFVDTNYYIVISLYKQDLGYEEDLVRNMISLDKAINLALDKMDIEDEEKIIDHRLATVKVKNNIDDLIGDCEIHLAYIIKTDIRTIYIDAYEGFLLYEDLNKAVRGGAVGAKELSTASNSVVLAKNKLQMMGYITTSSSLTYKLKTSVPSLLKNSFYACAHGNSSVISSRYDLTDPDRVFYASSVPSSSSYRFVFLDACGTASSTWKNAFGISNSSSYKAFMGWSSTVGATAAYEFCQYFWNDVSYITPVRTAAINAITLQGDNLPMSFTGDNSYNGYY